MTNVCRIKEKYIYIYLNIYFILSYFCIYFVYNLKHYFLEYFTLEFLFSQTLKVCFKYFHGSLFFAANEVNKVSSLFMMILYDSYTVNQRN